MKLSVSLTEHDVDFIDEYAANHRLGSRSGVVQRAVSLLRASELGDDYAAAWEEWQSSSDGKAWDLVVADGVESSR